MNKFINNAITKQDSAWKREYADRAFAFSCDMCSSRNLLHIPCHHCPIKIAHDRAIQEIESGERIRPRSRKFVNDSSVKVYFDKKGHKTVVVIEAENLEVQIKKKE